MNRKKGQQREKKLDFFVILKYSGRGDKSRLESREAERKDGVVMTHDLHAVGHPTWYPWTNVSRGVGWTYHPDTSFAAGIVYLYIDIAAEGERVPEVILAHQVPGEAFRQRGTEAGVPRIYERRASWKLPIGRHDPGRDACDPFRTLRVEVAQETGGLDINGLISWEQALVFGQPSRRPGSEFHEDIFFLVLSTTRPTIGVGLEQSKDDTDRAVYCHIDKLPLETIETNNKRDPRFLGNTLSRNHCLVLAEILKRIPGNDWWGYRVDEVLVQKVIKDLTEAGAQGRRGYVRT